MGGGAGKNDENRRGDTVTCEKLRGQRVNMDNFSEMPHLGMPPTFPSSQPQPRARSLTKAQKRRKVRTLERRSEKKGDLDV